MTRDRFFRCAVASLSVALAACGGGTAPDAATTDAPADPIRAEFQAIADRLFAGENEYLGSGPVERWRANAADSGRTTDERALATAMLGLQQLRTGAIDDAIESVEAALALARAPGVAPRVQAEVLRVHGLAFLRQAEVENCVRRHNRDCCILPLRDGGLHSVSAPARRARESFEAYLRLEPRDFTTVWLLNIVAMAIGDWPEAVPGQYRVPESVFAPVGELRRFVDRAPQLGVDAFNLCGGVIADDVDGDDRLDIITSTFDPRGSLTYYRQRDDGTFEDRSAASGLDSQLGGLNCIGADYDNDGDLDVLVLRGAWLLEDGRIRNSLLRNDGGTFTDVTRAAGMAEPARPTQAAAWGDYDNDGDLDLYVVNESLEAHGGTAHAAQLFRNDGDGSFTDIAAWAGVTNDRFAKGVSAGDYDNDGDLDIYVSNMGANRLYRNNGEARFTDVAPALGMTGPEPESFACWFYDHDNDGWLDLFVTAYRAGVEDVVRDLLGAPHQAATPRLYRNRGNGGFEDITAAAGLEHAWLPMGANFGDVDNDGWLDLYLTTGDPQYESLMPNVLLRNIGGERYRDETVAAGLGHLQKGHGVAFFDYDGDGDQDIYHQLGGFYPGDGFRNALFENPGQGGRLLTLRLVGTTSNRSAIGARVEVTVETPTGTRRIHRAVGSVSSFGGSPLRQEIGLGDATAVTSIRVSWPTSGRTQTITDAPLGGRLDITEPEGP